MQKQPNHLNQFCVLPLCGRRGYLMISDRTSPIALIQKNNPFNEIFALEFHVFLRSSSKGFYSLFAPFPQWSCSLIKSTVPFHTVWHPGSLKNSWESKSQLILLVDIGRKTNSTEVSCQ